MSFDDLIEETEKKLIEDVAHNGFDNGVLDLDYVKAAVAHHLDQLSLLIQLRVKRYGPLKEDWKW